MPATFSPRHTFNGSSDFTAWTSIQYPSFRQTTGGAIRTTQTSSAALLEHHDRDYAWALEFTGGSSASIAAEIELALSHVTREGIALPRPHDIRAYLVQHWDMLDIVLMVCQQASRSAGAGTQLSLELRGDTEADDEYITLYLRQDPYAEDILDVIDNIRLPFEDVMARRTGWFLVTTDFRRAE